MDQQILTEKRDSMLTIILNNPEKMNAIGIEMIGQLKSALSRAESDQYIRVVIVTGAGNKSFSAGGNLKEFESLDKRGVAEWIRSGHEAFNQLENFSKPVIAAISGYCLGGGLELALACDFRIATENSVFGSPELKHGWIPGWGGLARLKRLIGEARAKEIIFLSEQFDAVKAHEMGLLYKVTKTQHLMEETEQLADKLGTIDPHVFAMAKRAIMDPQHSTYEHGQMYDVLSTLYSKFLK
jgi:enoyl-CoA hydratase/carnithine racemase